MSRLRLRPLLGALLTGATWALVAANLLPIAWMVWCSLKGNEDILSGSLGLGRRRSEVVLVAPDATGWTVGSSDGGIARFEVRDKGLARVAGRNLGTWATSWLADGPRLWSFSADRGLRLHGAGFEAVKAWDMGALRRSWNADPRRGPWKTVWVNDVRGTSLAKVGSRILAALRMDGSPGLIVLDPASGSLDFPGKEAGIDQPVDQVVAIPGEELALLVGPRGLLVWDVQGRVGVRSFQWGQAGLPWDRPAQLLAGREGRVLLGDGGAIRTWSWKGDGSGMERVREAGLGQGSFLSLAWGLGDTALWIGASRGAAWCPLGDSSLRGVRGGALEAFGASALAQGERGLLAGNERGEVRWLDPQRLRELGRDSLPAPRLDIRWRNYVDLWRNLPFGTYLANSLIVCTSVMLVCMLLASMAGYALARFEFPGKEIFGYSILATQMIPGILFLIPLYILFVRAGEATGIPIVGTRWGLVLLYSAFYVPFTIWILRGFFAAIPRELEEAALVDGCTPFQAFWSVVVPAALPGIVASGIYVFLTVWDELLFAWILTNAETSTIPVGIRLFAGNYQNRYDLMMAAATVATLPVMLLFFLMQRRIVSGLTAGAVKG